MALFLLRLRRTLSLSSTLTRSLNSTSSSPPSLMISSISIEAQNPNFNLIQRLSHFDSQSRSFKSSTISLLSSRPRHQYNEGEQIDPNAILFEGCDYNHWLITIDFPKDPRPTPEEMVEFYVQTASKVVGSIEEAKKRIYACSTTTYEGFQIEVSEEMSQKFEGLPGVVFILPDSYIDPVNKEYGGDKYENGKITHRPPPIQYRKTGGGGRFNDGNRGFDRRDSYQQGGDTRGSGYQQNNNKFPPRTDQRREAMPRSNNNNYYNAQGNYGQGDRGNYNPQGQRDFQSGPRNYSPPGIENYGLGTTAGNLEKGAAGGNFGQGAVSGDPGQGAASDNFRQGASSGIFRQGSASGGDGGGFRQEGSGGFGQESVGNYRQMAATGNHGQGATGDSFRQGSGGGGGGDGGFSQESVGNYGQGGADGFGQRAGSGFGQQPVGNYWQGAGSGFGQESDNYGPRGQPSGSHGDFGQAQNRDFANVPRIG